MNYRETFTNFERMKPFHMNKSPSEDSNFQVKPTLSPRTIEKTKTLNFPKEVSQEKRFSLLNQRSQDLLRSNKQNIAVRGISSNKEKGPEDLLAENRELRQKIEILQQERDLIKCWKKPRTAPDTRVYQEKLNFLVKNIQKFLNSSLKFQAMLREKLGHSAASLYEEERNLLKNNMNSAVEEFGLTDLKFSPFSSPLRGAKSPRLEEYSSVDSETTKIMEELKIEKNKTKKLQNELNLEMSRKENEMKLIREKIMELELIEKAKIDTEKKLLKSTTEWANEKRELLRENDKLRTECQKFKEKLINFDSINEEIQQESANLSTKCDQLIQENLKLSESLQSYDRLYNYSKKWAEKAVEEFKNSIESEVNDLSLIVEKKLSDLEKIEVKVNEFKGFGKMKENYEAKISALNGKYERKKAEAEKYEKEIQELVGKYKSFVVENSEIEKTIEKTEHEWKQKLEEAEEVIQMLKIDRNDAILETDHLKIEKASAEQEIERLKSVINETQEKLNKFETKLNQKEEENKVLLIQNSEINRNAQKDKENYKKVYEENQELKSIMQNVEGSISDLEIISVENANLKAKIKFLESEIYELKNKEFGHESEKNELNLQKMSFQSEKNSLIEENKKLTELFESLQKNNIKMKNELETLNTKNNELNEEIIKSNAKVEKISRENGQIYRDLIEKEKKLKESLNVIEDLNLEIEKSSCTAENNQNLIKKMQELRSEIRKRDEQMEILKRSEEEKGLSLARKKEKIQKLRELERQAKLLIHDQESVIQNLNSDQEKSKAKFEELVQTQLLVESLSTEISDKELIISNQNQKIQSLLNQISGNTDSCEKLKRSLLESHQECTAVEKNLKISEEESRKYQNKNVELSKQIEALELKLANIIAEYTTQISNSNDEKNKMYVQLIDCLEITNQQDLKNQSLIEEKQFLENKITQLQAELRENDQKSLKLMVELQESKASISTILAQFDESSIADKEEISRLNNELMKQFHIIENQKKEIASVTQSLLASETALKQCESCKVFEANIESQKEKISDLECLIHSAEEALGGFFYNSLTESITSLVSSKTQGVRRAPRAPVSRSRVELSMKQQEKAEILEEINVKASVQSEGSKKSRSSAISLPEAFELHNELQEEKNESERYLSQIKLLKEDIRELERKLKRSNDINDKTNAEVLKSTLVKMVRALPIQNGEIESMIGLLFSIISVPKEEISKIEPERKAKSAKRFGVF